MRRFFIVLGIFTATVFAAMFASTWFAKSYIQERAKNYLVERTFPFANRTVELAKKALAVVPVQAEQHVQLVQATKKEIENYENDPRRYLEHLVDLTIDELPKEKPKARQNAFQEKASEWKSKIREHINATMDRLIADLRIFSATNIVAGLLVSVFAYLAQSKNSKWLMPASFLLFASMVFCAYHYYDSLTFFRILMGFYIGWFYPALLSIAFVGSYIESRRWVVGMSKRVQR
jgi:hypothetical protein